MKFFAAIMLYVIAAAAIAVGIVHAVHGSYWLLATSTLVYMLALIKFGCQTH